MPLRHLITSLDGKVTSGDSWTGNIGKLLKKVNSLPFAEHFEAVSVGPPLEELDEHVIRDLSNDQKYGYKICRSLRSGVLDKTIKNIKIGKGK